MTRYNDSDTEEYDVWNAYREGVDRVLEYVDSVQVYPKLTAELRWAIQQGII